MEQWIEEFLYRGRPANGPDSDKVPTFSVTVGFRMVHPVTGEHMPPTFQQVTPEKAEAMGLSLADLVNGVNADAVNEVARLTEVVATKDGVIDRLEMEADDLRRQIAEYAKAE